jgi:hypothetical protein
MELILRPVFYSQYSPLTIYASRIIIQTSLQYKPGFKKDFPMSTDPIQNAQKRAFQYWYVDGTFEFSFGSISLLLAAYFYAQRLWAEAWFGSLLTAMFILILFGGGWLVRRLVMSMKERITFPRTGYITFRREKSSKRLTKGLLLGLAAAITSSTMTFLLLNRPPSFDWTTAATGLMFCIVIAYLGVRTSLARFFINAVVSLAAGVALGFANLSEGLGLTSFYGILGLALLVVGGLSLWQYLRQNPAPAEASDDK